MNKYSDSYSHYSFFLHVTLVLNLIFDILFHHRNEIRVMRIITWFYDSKLEKMDRVKKKIRPSLLKSKSFRYVSFRRKKDKTNSDYAPIVPNLGKSWQWNNISGFSKFR